MIVLRYIYSYLNAFIPANHFSMAAEHNKRKVNVFMGAATIVALLVGLRMPFILHDAPQIAVMTGFLISCIVLSIIWIIYSQAKYLNIIIGSLIFLAIVVNLASSYTLYQYPPISIPFIGVSIVALHFVFGRWIALFAIIFQLALYYPLLYFPSPDDNLAGFLTADEIPFWRYRFFMNNVLASFIILAICEAYKRSRDLSEEKLKNLRQKFDRDLQLARLVQADLIPPSIQEGHYISAAYMEPAIEVGGDYVDRIDLDDRIYFAMGDVSGHGIQAGMLAMQARSILHQVLKIHRKPASIIRELNNAFYDQLKDLGSRNFMTFVILAVDQRGMVRYSGCHLDILVFRSRGRFLDIISTQGTWLGLHSLQQSDEIFEGALQLEIGDILLLYTDGLVEVTNPTEEYFGSERLASVFMEAASETGDPETINQMVLKAWQDFHKKNTVEDDVTLLTVRRCQ